MAPPGAVQGIRPVDQSEHRTGKACGAAYRGFPEFLAPPL